MAQLSGPAISVVIPCRNAAATLERCLQALRREKQSGAPIIEIIIVDDASHDASGTIAKQLGAQVLRFDQRQGDCAARNAGAAAAHGELLWFLDADVEPEAGSGRLIADFFTRRPDAVAAIGSYDDDPPAPGTVSQFKNLFHHYVHQQGPDEVSTFWTGCGIVRRKTFMELGGFDDSFRPGTSVADLHFGYQLRQHGTRVRLLKQLRVKHYKCWSLRDLIRTEIWDRAVPWTILRQRYPDFGEGELNLGREYKAAVILAWLAVWGIMLGFVWQWLWPLAGICLVLMFVLHRELLFHFSERRGDGFMLRCLPLLWLYFFYCGIGYLLGRWAARGIASRE